jgi:GMP synthase-like glutamine amidotransferase
VPRDREVSIERVEVDAGEPIPDWREFDAIVAMGGPMSVNDPFDWLATEKLVVAEAVRAGAPFFGACLGAQLLAASLGAAVYPGPAPEVGLLPVTLGDAALADPVFAGLPRQPLTLQWHGETFDLPDGAVALASSPAYPNQAFAGVGARMPSSSTSKSHRRWRATGPRPRPMRNRWRGRWGPARSRCCSASSAIAPTNSIRRAGRCSLNGSRAPSCRPALLASRPHDLRHR